MHAGSIAVLRLMQLHRLHLRRCQSCVTAYTVRRPCVVWSKNLWSKKTSRIPYHPMTTLGALATPAKRESHVAAVRVSTHARFSHVRARAIGAATWENVGTFGNSNSNLASFLRSRRLTALDPSTIPRRCYAPTFLMNASVDGLHPCQTRRPCPLVATCLHTVDHLRCDVI
ncbi:hypothetical protein OH77DRAFT_378944 [Trametes cingulata]|nr:hypothetical protein OH77DRAFT_378944 [Trametes cingulata]